MKKKAWLLHFTRVATFLQSSYKKRKKRGKTQKGKNLLLGLKKENTVIKNKHLQKH